MILSDYHLHTFFSGDSSAPPEDMVDYAVELGLTEIAITDHLDLTLPGVVHYPRGGLEGYVSAITALAERYADTITIRLGLELGLAPETVHMADGITESHPFDFIICSTHDIKGEGLYSGSFYAGKTKLEAYDEYFRQVLGVVESDAHFNVYGHLDYVERYSGYKEGSVYYREHVDVIDAILKRLVETGRGLEVNSSGFRYGIGHFNPQPEILLRYKELGGEIITIGSDAHRPGNIADCFEKTREILLSLGFAYATRFKGMKPIMFKL